MRWCWLSTTAVRLRVRHRTCPCAVERLDLRRRHANRYRSLARGHPSRIRLQRARDETDFFTFVKAAGENPKGVGPIDGVDLMPRSRVEKACQGTPSIGTSTQQPRRLSRHCVGEPGSRYEDGKSVRFVQSASVKISQKSIPGKSPRCAKNSTNGTRTDAEILRPKGKDGKKPWRP